jgi:rSAM-associated Gly-rich repeat protein
MSDVTRRQLLVGFLGGLSQAVGTVVVASTVLRAAQAESPVSEKAGQQQPSLKERADQVAADRGALDGEEELHLAEFVNGGFRKGGFVNGGGGGGGFRNGGFENGGFRKGGFVNGGGFNNGAFRKGGFVNY